MSKLPPGIAHPEYRELLRRAQRIGATEMAVFAIEQRFLRKTRLTALAHVRPEACTAEMRAAALGAFDEIVRVCLQHQRDGTIEVTQSRDEERGTQYCLVTLARREGRVIGAGAFIARFHTSEAAKDALRRLS